MSLLLDDELQFLRFLDPRVADLDRSLERQRTIHTRESLVALKRLLEVYHSAVVEALLDNPGECSGQFIDTQLYDGPFKPAIVAASPSVCQVLYSDGSPSFRPCGTAFLVHSVDTLLTAGHVLPDSWVRHRVGQLKVRFGFERKPDGSIAPTEDFPITDEIDYFRGGLDFVLLKAGPDVSGKLPGAVCSTLPLAKATKVNLGDPLFCLHHPTGAPKKVSIGSLKEIGDWYFLYDTHTDSCSSGAPVIDQAGEVVALHRRQQPDGRCYRQGGTSDAVKQASTVL